MKRLERIWVSQEAKKALRIRAAEEGTTLKEVLDKVVLDKTDVKKMKNRRIDDYRFL